MRISDWSSDVCSSDLQIFRAVLADPPRFALQRALVKGGRQVCAWTPRRNLVGRVEQVVGLSQDAIERPAFGTLAFFIIAQHHPGRIEQRQDVAASLSQEQRRKPRHLPGNLVGPAPPVAPRPAHTPARAPLSGSTAKRGGG